MTDRLKGKVILLTGAGGGLGSSQARLMTKSAALEFVDDNIRINSICPGMFDTNLFESSVPKETWEPLVAMVPMKSAMARSSLPRTSLLS